MVAIAAGFGLSIVLAWLPLLGPLIAGTVAGMMMDGGPRKGAVAGFLGGLIAMLVLSIAFFGFGQVIGSLVSNGSLAISQGLGIGLSLAFIILDLSSLILITIGGFLGGTLTYENRRMVRAVRRSPR